MAQAQPFQHLDIPCHCAYVHPRNGSRPPFPALTVNLCNSLPSCILSGMARALSETPAVNGTDSEAQRRTFWPLTLGCMGVVYGDIGTSPLYAFRVALDAAGGSQGDLSRATVIGVLSLILWALFLVVTAKYVLILLRADNKGEGGTLSLMALAQRALKSARAQSVVVVLGMIAAALFYGDALLTPAISVLSAVEGLEVAAPQLQSYVVPVTVLILIALFSVQSRGTAHVAAFFRPGDDAVVHHTRLGGARAYRRRPRGVRRVQSGARRWLPGDPWHHRAGDAWRSVPCRHRRRGALRRPRPFRAEADPNGVALFRAAGACPELPRTRGAGSVRPDRDRQPVLSARAVNGRSTR